LTTPTKSIIHLVNRKSLLKALVGLGLLTFLSWNCTKIRVTDIGTDLLPAIDNVHTFDTTLELTTTNFLFGDSAVPTMGRLLSGSVSPHMLGMVTNDPQFGTTMASMFLEAKPGYYPYVFENVKDSLYLDSVVLCLRWLYTWGDTMATQKVNVYRMTELLTPDSAYPTNTTVSYSTLLGSKTFTPNILDDSLFLDRETAANQLRIRLNDDFGRFLLAQDTAPGSPYYNDTLFRRFFNGYAVVPDPGGSSSANALMGFALSDTGTYVNLYYRYTKNGKLDTTFRKMKMDNGANGAHANVISRNYSGSQIAQHLGKPPAGDSIIYIQTAPGSYAKLDMPSLQGFKDTKGNVIIHRAELYMSQLASPPYELDNYLVPPGNLYIDYFDSDSLVQRPFLLDAFNSLVYAPGTFGGLRKYVTDTYGNLVAEYRFDIARYVQGIVTRSNKPYQVFLYSPNSARYPGILLSVPINPVAYGRVKLGGGNLHSDQRMRLRIIYSKL
jgi:hypothetical protein